DRLITKSPWAKPIKAQYASGAGNSGDGGGYPGGTGTGTGGGYPGGGQGGGYPGGGGRSRGGGIGIPGIGGIGIAGICGLEQRAGGEPPPRARRHEIPAAQTLGGTLRDMRQRDSADGRPIHQRRRRRRF